MRANKGPGRREGLGGGGGCFFFQGHVRRFMIDLSVNEEEGIKAKS
jgi:hypothetical protein